jgi:Transposase IS116/IS110/IS902 family
VIAAIADGRTFHNGRQFAAWIGLVPRQHSSGDKQRQFGITKQGDPYLRTLLIHGARSVVYRASNKSDSRSQWIAEKQRKLGTAKTCVALANKNARVTWALLARDEPYRRAFQVERLKFLRDCRPIRVMAKTARPACLKPDMGAGPRQRPMTYSRRTSADSIRARG